jgi:hypothetical protein
LGNDAGQAFKFASDVKRQSAFAIALVDSRGIGGEKLTDDVWRSTHLTSQVDRQRTRVGLYGARTRPG